MIVIKDAMLKIMIEVTDEYREKDNMVTKAKAHSRIRKKRPKPMPSTLGPSSAIRFSSFCDGDDIILKGKNVIFFWLDSNRYAFLLFNRSCFLLYTT